MRRHIIKLTIATADQPGKPIPLDEEAIKKMASISPVLRRLEKSYGPKLKSMEIVDAEIVVTIDEEADLGGDHSILIENILICAQRLTENAQCRPPLPLQQVTSDQTSVDLLKTLSKEGRSTGLRLTVETTSGVTELPCLPLEFFTEPDENKSQVRQVSYPIIGVCQESQDAHTVVLRNESLLFLPREHYPQTLLELIEMVFNGDCRFSGYVELIRPGALRAQHGGGLLHQLRLDRSDSSTDGFSTN